MTAVEGITEYVAKFACETALSGVPPTVLARARRGMLDGLALAVAGSRSAPFEVGSAYLYSLGGSNESGVAGSHLRLPARGAAFLTGLAIHAHDYDDTQLASSDDRVYGYLMHPTGPALAASMAVGEKLGSTGEDVLLAYLIGVDVACKVAETIKPDHYERGLHTSGTIGALGATVAAARLYGLNRNQMKMAIGLGASQSAGIGRNLGTMTKPFHVARAAESGVVAAELVAGGFTASSDVLEAPRGFFASMSTGFDPEYIEGRLGNPWTFDEPGVSIKPHPCGSLIHPAMYAMEGLLEEHGFSADDVVRGTIGGHRNTVQALVHNRPQNHIQAKFSMEYCVALRLLGRPAGLADFTDEVVQNPTIQAALRKFDLVSDPAAEAMGYRAMTSIVTVELADGSTVSRTEGYALGSPQVPMSDERLMEKVTECFTWRGLTTDAAVSLEMAVAGVAGADLGSDLLVPCLPERSHV